MTLNKSGRTKEDCKRIKPTRREHRGFWYTFVYV